VAARSWVLDAQGNKVYGSWTKIKKIKITVVTPQQPKIKDITVKENTVTVTYTKCKNATGYEILLGNKYKTSAGEKYPVKKYVKRTEGKNTVTVTFTNVKKGTWYVTVRSWNKTSKNKSRVYSPYSDIKKITGDFLLLFQINVSYFTTRTLETPSIAFSSSSASLDAVLSRSMRV